MAGKFVSFEVVENVAEITLNRPDVLNSFSAEMAKEVQAALNEAEKSPSVRAIILTAAGRAFCAGQDLSEVAPRKDGSLPELGPIVRECYNPIIQKIRSIEKPVVCAVNGTAAGAGANLAFSCDIVLASYAANFIQSFSNVGLIPDSGGTFFLPRLIGLGRATALTMLGDKLSAQDAEKLGLVWKVFPPETLLTEARKIAATLAAKPTRGLGLTKRAFNASWTNSIEQQLKVEEELQAEAGRTHDYREGVTAFLEKRKPVFLGK